MVKKFDVSALRRDPRIAYYFRYALHHRDFRELRDADGRLLGRFAAKPLYGKLTRAGRVDRSAGFNGQVAVIFIPARARTARRAKLLLTRMPRARVALPNGKRNWDAIRDGRMTATRIALSSSVVRRPSLLSLSSLKSPPALGISP
jgi:hypothetical protein